MHCLSETLLLADNWATLAALPDWLDQILSKVLPFLSGLWQTAWPVLLLVFGFGLVIFVHELGHFVAAKWVGIQVDVFSLGFGRRLLGFTAGGTEYRISIIPLGGYIKMLGQDDLRPGERVDDERSLCNKSIAQRLLVFSSGVIMNLICAALMFIILFRFTGVSFQRPEVGDLEPGKPAEIAGVLPGDTILAINGKAVRDFGELSSRIALAPGGKDISLTIRRPGQEKPFDLAIRAATDSKVGIPQIGIFGPQTLTVYSPGDYAGPAGLKNGDKIIALEYDGQRHPVDKFYQFDEIIRARRAKPTNIIATRDSQELPPIMVRPHLTGRSHIMGLLTPTRIAFVSGDSPAEKVGLKPGDVITSFNGHTWPDVSAVSKIAELAGKQQQKVSLTVIRAGKTVEMKLVPRKKGRKQVPLGIEIERDHQNLYVANSYPELYKPEDNFKELTLPSDQKIYVPPLAKLLALNGQRLANWSDFIDQLQAKAGSEVALSYSLGGKSQTISFVVPTAESPVWRQHWRFAVNLTTYPDEMKVKSDSWPGAVYIGMHKTWFWLQGVYLTLTRVAQGSIKTTALSGPVGIFNLGVQVAQERGVAHFFYLMAIIGVNLAIINFLPIPVLDGGHALFLLFEKIKGSPVSVRVQTIASQIAMAALGVFFLFITYNDIARIVRGWLE